jgi:tRNA(adenine34) deaminase
MALAEAEAADVRARCPWGRGGDPGRVIARAHNQTETLHDVTAHAEMRHHIGRQHVGGKYLPHCTLYVPP